MACTLHTVYINLYRHPSSLKVLGPEVLGPNYLCFGSKH